MPHEYLSEEHTRRYRRFIDDPLPGELELFFRIDAETLAHAKAERRSHNRLGWSVQWGTIRMLGTVLSIVRHLHGAAVDDALLLFDALMTTKLLARAERLSTAEQLRGFDGAGVVAGVLAALKDVAGADAELAAQAEADGLTAGRVAIF